MVLICVTIQIKKYVLFAILTIYVISAVKSTWPVSILYDLGLLCGVQNSPPGSRAIVQEYKTL